MAGDWLAARRTEVAADRILDAAGELFAAQPAATVGMHDIASAAGCSRATLYRYFETLDELRQATVARYFERFSHLFDIPDIGIGTLDERIARFVAARQALYEATEPMARLARDRAPVVAAFGSGLHEGRSMLAGHVRRHFAAEIAARPPARREDLVAVVSTLTSFESWAHLRDEYQQSAAQTRRVWVDALGVLLRAS